MDGNPFGGFLLFWPVEIRKPLPIILAYMFFNGRAYVNRGRSEQTPGKFRIVEIVTENRRVGLTGRYETREAANKVVRTQYGDRHCEVVEV